MISKTRWNVDGHFIDADEYTRFAAINAAARELWVQNNNFKQLIAIVSTHRMTTMIDHTTLWGCTIFASAFIILIFWSSFRDLHHVLQTFRNQRWYRARAKGEKKKIFHYDERGALFRVMQN